MLSQIISSRFSENGRLRRITKVAQELCYQNPNSKFAREILSFLRKKLWFGSRSISYSLISSLAWERFTSYQDTNILKIRNLYLTNDNALISEYSDIFLSDIYETFSDFKDDEHLAAKLLACLSIEGPYQSRNVNIQYGDVVIDAGANMGLFSLYATSKAKKIYAFEPQKRAVDIFCRNIDLNNANNKISLVQLGLSDKNESVK